jgi:hypothetical protein
MSELRERGHELYGLLVPQAAAEMIAKAAMVYIVPTGPLYLLPFEALTVTKETNGKGPHFLVEEHPIAYLTSASLLKILREAETRKKAKAKNPLLAFANPV